MPFESKNNIYKLSKSKHKPNIQINSLTKKETKDKKGNNEKKKMMNDWHSINIYRQQGNNTETFNNWMLFIMCTTKPEYEI